MFPFSPASMGPPNLLCAKYKLVCRQRDCGLSLMALLVQGDLAGPRGSAPLAALPPFILVLSPPGASLLKGEVLQVRTSAEFPSEAACAGAHRRPDASRPGHGSQALLVSCPCPATVSSVGVLTHGEQLAAPV